MGEQLLCKQKVMGSSPIDSTVTEDAAEWTATGLENQGIAAKL